MSKRKIGKEVVESSSEEELYTEDDEEELEFEDDSEEEEEEEEEEDGDSSSLDSEEGENEDEAISEAKLKEIEKHARVIHADDLESDDDEANNTIGDVPLRWYDDFPHLGYNLEGERVMKRNQGDNLDQAVQRADDPNYKWTIYDEKNDREIVLTPREITLLRRMQTGQVAHPEHNPYPDYIDYYTGIENIHTLGSDKPEPKRRFLPSKWEWMRVMKIAKGIKEGKIQITEKDKKKDQDDLYMLWGEDGRATGSELWRGAPHVPAPKLKLPGHAESYNPPEEFLPSNEEIEKWAKMDPTDRPYDFIPKKFDSLRHVSGYKDFIKQRFERCLDLYLCPRVNKNRLTINPDSLIPKLPKPDELKPFPTGLSIKFTGHEKRIRCISIDPHGEWIASGSDDGTVRLWEIDTGRCEAIWKVDGVVYDVAWNPNPEFAIIAACAGNKVVIIDPATANSSNADETESVFTGVRDTDPSILSEGRAKVEWIDEKIEEASSSKRKGGVRLSIVHNGAVKKIAWHHKGDYLSSVAPDLNNSSVTIHQLSKRKSQHPFAKMKGQVQAVSFHPNKPFFFVATQTSIRVYHLVKQALIKKLQTGAKWISSMHVHKSGDHVIMGSYDKRVCWFDLDLGSSPYKTLRYHTKAVRSVGFHDHYPLMASASDDGTIQVFHAKIYTDLVTNPLIVPVKILRGHEVVGELGVLNCVWHPSQPWLLTSGADATIRLYTNI